MNSQKGKIALVTGASAGIGKAIAELHASKRGDLVLVARRKERLESLRASIIQKYKTNVEIIVADLSRRESPKEIFQELQDKKITIDYLVNNAGFSQQGYFHEIDWKKQEAIMMVNMMALVEMAHLILPGMVERNSGKILNVASSAAFAPGGPLQTIYYATKAFIVSFSQGLAGELTESKVTVTALCPGATETEFENVSGLDKTNIFTTEKVFSAEEVAIDGYDAMLKGRLVKLSALSSVNKFVLKNMSLFPAGKILHQIRQRQEVKK